VESFTALAVKAKGVRGYFVIGEKDHTLERAREIQSMLKEHDIPFIEEVHPDLGHEFPINFELSLERALEFIFEE
jgi:predicted methyltransferase